MKRIAILLPVLLAVAACHSDPPPQFAWDKAVSFASVKTYAWYDGPPFKYPQGGGMVDGRFIDDHVRRAVEKELARKGYSKVDSGTPDVFVTYHTSQDSIVDHDVYGAYGWWSPYIHVASNYYKEGTLALDIRDPSKKLVWRGMLGTFIGRNPEELNDRIEKSVAKLLEKFPPPAGS